MCVYVHARARACVCAHVRPCVCDYVQTQRAQKETESAQRSAQAAEAAFMNLMDEVDDSDTEPADGEVQPNSLPPKNQQRSAVTAGCIHPWHLVAVLGVCALVHAQVHVRARARACVCVRVCKLVDPL